MPAKSKAQRKAMAIAEHHPEKLYKRNRGMTKMSKKQLQDFAKTKEAKLPAHVKHERKESKKQERAEHKSERRNPKLRG